MPTSQLVSTAAAAAAVIPFHCIICFEEFNLISRFPVVLPCGHTYICALCARRLKRCMECREPLTIQSSTATKVHPPNGRHGPPLYPPRHHHHQAPHSPGPSAASGPHNSDPIALPVPKNVVLISIMEAAQRQTFESEEQQQNGENDNSEKDSSLLEEAETDRSDLSDDNDEDEFDTNRIISALTTFGGSSGTYSVCDPIGLCVEPLHPNKKGQFTNPENDINEENESQDSNMIKLSRGQTVQVVSFSGGVATLARNAGFVKATSSQLVKVGAPRDQCCKIEGMIETVKIRGKDLQKALSENEKLELALKEKMLIAQKEEPSYPVISQPKDQVYDAKIQRKPADGGAKADCEDRMYLYQDQLLIPDSPGQIFVAEASDSSGLELVGESRSLLYPEHSPNVPASPHSIDNSDFNRHDVDAPGIPRYRRNSEDDLNAFSYGCGSTLFGKTFLNFDNEGEHLEDSLESIQQPASPPLRRINHGSLASPSRPLQQQSHLSSFISAATPMLSSSFDAAVDWRTGLSGHRALSKTSPRSNAVSRTASAVRMMSEHRGIGSIRASSSRNSNSPSSSPACDQRLISPADECCGDE